MKVIFVLPIIAALAATIHVLMRTPFGSRIFKIGRLYACALCGFLAIMVGYLSYIR